MRPGLPPGLHRGQPVAPRPVRSPWGLAGCASGSPHFLSGYQDLLVSHTSPCPPHPWYPWSARDLTLTCSVGLLANLETWRHHKSWRREKKMDVRVSICALPCSHSARGCQHPSEEGGRGVAPSATPHTLIPHLKPHPVPPHPAPPRPLPFSTYRKLFACLEITIAPASPAGRGPVGGSRWGRTARPARRRGSGQSHQLATARFMIIFCLGMESNQTPRVLWGLALLALLVGLAVLAAGTPPHTKGERVKVLPPGLGGSVAWRPQGEQRQGHVRPVRDRAGPTRADQGRLHEIKISGQSSLARAGCGSVGWNRPAIGE